MTEAMMKKIAVAVALLLVAALSFMFLADKASAPATHQHTIEGIDEKTDTVLKLTAASTLVSAGLSAIPGDTATPISEKLADFTEYFLVVLCVLYAEKYLLTIIGVATFRILIPAACVLLIAGMFWKPAVMKRIAGKMAIFGIILYLAIPASIRVSDMIYETYNASISATLSAAESITDKTDVLSDGEDNGIGLNLWKQISETASTLTDKAADLLNRFVQALAVIIVTSCVIPILSLIFFLWLIKVLTGIEIPAPRVLRGEGRRRKEPANGKQETLPEGKEP